nr:hypothetical protein [Tanacetum cinerariifolium]
MLGGLYLHYKEYGLLVHNLAKSLPTQFTERIDSGATTIPRIISNALAQQLLDLLTTTIKNNLPQALTQAVRDTLPGFNRRIRNFIKDEILEVLNISVLNPMYKEFNALNKLEVSKMLHSSTKVPRDILVVNAKHLQTKVNRTSTDLHETTNFSVSAQEEQQSSDASDGQNSSTLMVHSTDEEPPSKKLKVVKAIPSIPNHIPLNTIRPIIFDSIPLLKGGSAPSLSYLQNFKEVGEVPMTLEEEKLQLKEAKRLAQEQELVEIEAQRTQHMNKTREEYMHCINFKDDPLPIAKFNYKKLIHIDSEYAQQVYKKLIYEIEARPDFVKARKIVENFLDDL